VTDALGRLGLLLAGVGSLATIMIRLQRAPAELFAAGKVVGKVEAMSEAADADADVIILSDHRTTGHTVGHTQK